MQPQTSVVECLQECASIHWTAIQNYKSQHHHFGRFGYSKLAEKMKADVSEELEHLDKLINRLEQFDVTVEFKHDLPDYPSLPDIKGLLKANLLLEKKAQECERECILKARSSGDEVTAKLVADNLEGSEASIVELDAMLRQLDAIGKDNWLADKL